MQAAEDSEEEEGEEEDSLDGFVEDDGKEIGPEFSRAIQRLFPTGRYGCAITYEATVAS